MEFENQSRFKAKEQAKEFYKSIGEAWCPPLKSWVKFDSSGFKHIIQKTNIPRSKAEQRRRFALLPDAVSILKDKNILPKHIIKNTNPIPIHLWVFIKIKDDMRITVVVRQSGNSAYHFLSVYEKKQKSPQ
jgi:hypothetical protein